MRSYSDPNEIQTGIRRVMSLPHTLSYTHTHTRSRNVSAVILLFKADSGSLWIVVRDWCEASKKRHVSVSRLQFIIQDQNTFRGYLLEVYEPLKMTHFVFWSTSSCLTKSRIEGKAREGSGSAVQLSQP